MSAKVDSYIAANARAKLERLQKSSINHSFFNVDAIDVFSNVEGTAFAGVPLKRTKVFDDPSSRWLIADDVENQALLGLCIYSFETPQLRTKS